MDTFPLITPAKKPVGSPSLIKYSFFLTSLISKFCAAFSRHFSSILLSWRNFCIPENPFNKEHIFFLNIFIIYCIFLLLDLYIYGHQ